MNQVIVTIATYVLASSISYFSMSADSTATVRQVPPPAPPVEATTDNEEQTVTGDAADVYLDCSDCHR
jgi:hypothetical protein